MLDFIRTTALGAVAALAIGATSAGAVTFSFDSNGGDGVGVDNGPNAAYDFQISLVSNNNGVDDIYTTATGVADYNYLVSGVWQYSTADVDGSSFDPFGYFIDNVFTSFFQLSEDGVPAPSFQNGAFSFVVKLGQSFGFYALATDGDLGSSTSIAYGNLTPTAVPLPAGGLLLLSALGGVALVRRRNKAAAV